LPGSWRESPVLDPFAATKELLRCAARSHGVATPRCLADNYRLQGRKTSSLSRGTNVRCPVRSCSGYTARAEPAPAICSSPPVPGTHRKQSPMARRTTWVCSVTPLTGCRPRTRALLRSSNATGEVADVQLAPGHARGGKTPDTEGVGVLAFATIAGAAFGAFAWFGGGPYADVGGLLGSMSWCGFIGALLGSRGR